MTLREELDIFYRKHNIPENGGLNDKSFEIPFPLFTLKLPNFSWRKRMLYIHDLEHILNEQDTTWFGEMYIASWEIATGFWRNFPIIFFPLWTMGWGIWKHPSAVYQGYTMGCNAYGIANLGLSEDQLLDMDLQRLKILVHKNSPPKPVISIYFKLVFWIFISQFFFLFPLILIILSAIIYFK